MSYVGLEEAILSQNPAVSGLLIADTNGLLIKGKGDLLDADPATTRKTAGRLVQVLRTAQGLSDSGADKVRIVLETVQNRQVSVSKAFDYYVIVSTTSGGSSSSSVSGLVAGSSSK